jgi:PAS domain S-box-containing protein
VWLPAGLSALLLLSIMVAFLWLSRQLDAHRYVLGLKLLAALFPLGLAGILLTAWFAKRAAWAHRRALENSGQEALLRDAIAALTGDQVLPAALNRIATNAMRMAKADAVFIEQSDAARGEVEIVAAVGTGAPPGGIRLRFVGSVTDDIVRAGTTALTEDLAGRDSDLAHALDPRWEHCFVLAVPLLSEGDVGGALVVMRRDQHIHARYETVSQLQALGAWAALALRRQHLALALATEHARLEAIVEQIPVGVVLAEAPSGRVALFNRHAVEMWGSPKTPPGSVEEYRHWKLFAPNGQPYETHERPLARSILHGVIVQGEEAVIEARDGSRKPVRVNSAPIRDVRGNIIAGVATIHDISEEKRREEATRFLDEISRQLASTLDYDATMEAILGLLVPRMCDFGSLHHRDNDTTIRKWASATREAKLNSLLTDLERNYPLPLPSAHPIAVAIRTGNPQLREVVDDELLVEVSRDARELEWLRALGIQSAIAVPLTVRGKTIGALQLLSMDPSHHFTCKDLEFTEEIARRAALAIDNAQLFRTVNETGRIERFLADAAMTLSGSLERDEVLRRVASLAVPTFADFTLAFVNDDRGGIQYIASAHRDATQQPLLEEAGGAYQPDLKNLRCSVCRALSTGQPVLVEQVTPAVLDGQSLEPHARELLGRLEPTSWMAIPLVAREKTLGVILFATVDSQHEYGANDVSVGQRLALAAALATQNATLFQAAQNALATRDEVLAIVSHDLRNPLHTIGMSVQLLLDLAPDEAERQRHLEVIGRAKDRMNRLIQDLLDVARIEAGKSLAIERRREHPSTLIAEAVEHFTLQAGEHHVQMEWNVAEDVPHVAVDVGRIIQVLSNLIGNALKFTPEGGRIEVRASKDRDMVVIAVKDSGPGIPAEDLERIFRPFWQAPRAARQGAGLGLAISRGIIEQHGGRLWAVSHEGSGSTFSFSLPEATSQKSRAA